MFLLTLTMKNGEVPSFLIFHYNDLVNLLAYPCMFVQFPSQIWEIYFWKKKIQFWFK